MTQHSSSYAIDIVHPKYPQRQQEEDVLHFNKIMIR